MFMEGDYKEYSEMNAREEAEEGNRVSTHWYYSVANKDRVGIRGTTGLTTETSK